MAQSRGRHLWVAGAGLLLLVVCGLIASTGTVGPAERRVFHAVNDLPGWLYQPLWVFQQFGNLFVAVGIGVVVALLLRQWWVAAAIAGAAVLKLAGERAVKQVVERSRPGTTIGVAYIHLHGAVPIHGFSFVSGHAVIATAVATLLTPILNGRWKVVPWVVVVLNGVARVYVGAHNPLDILGGVGLGLVIGGLLNVLVAPAPSVDDRTDELEATAAL
jgi:undecaprenyl-diphosphatase